MTVPSPSDGRAYTSHTHTGLSTSPPPEPLLVAPPAAPLLLGREPSVTRGRASSATSPRNASPRGKPSTSQSRPKRSVDIERKPSLSYGHHRQTSIVHGVQHTRNASLLASASTTSSPLSPAKALANSPQDVTGYNPTAALRQSPSFTGLHGISDGVTSPVNGISGTRRVERMQSTGLKRGSEHQRAQSKAQIQQEPKTVGEYALHHLFTSFIAEADERIELCRHQPPEPEPRIENICGPGADLAFDQLITSLGHINRHKPKSLIDSVIHWRKKKADTANNLFNELNALKDGSIYQTQRPVGNGGITALPLQSSGQDVSVLEFNVAIADQRSTISIYILCRVLIEIMGQTTLKALNGPDNNLDTAGRLEDVIYGQLQNADPDLLARSNIIRANWEIRGQLLGVMSGIRFEEVSNRFLRDLEQAQKKLAVKGIADPKLGSKTALLVQSMRWFKITTSPEDAWNRSCDMLRLLARFFAEVHGRAMKHAYAELFEQLMLSIAATATSELNAPKWKEVVATLHPRITQMLPKADHWPYAFPLQAVLLCASPFEQFAVQWLPLVTSLQPKARDRASRSHALKAVCRLVWRYLYRQPENSSFVSKKLDEIVKLVFQSGKRVLVSTDPAIADPLIQLIRIIGFKHQDICFRTIIFPLMNSELFSGAVKELKIENLDPEKTVIAIRAFLAVMADLEKGEPPPFPVRFESDDYVDPASRAPVSSHRRTRSQGFTVSAGRTERLSRPVMTNALNETAKDYYAKFCKMLGQLTIICDNTFGGQAVLDEKFASHTPKTPMAEAFTFNRRDELMNPTDLRQHYYDLLHVAVEALPRCFSTDLPINSLVNLLCTGTAHVQLHIATSSAQSLKSIARQTSQDGQSYAQQVTIGFARFIFNFDDRYATVSDGSLLGPGHIENTLKLYVELLQIWIDSITERIKQKAEPAYLTDDEEQEQKKSMRKLVETHIIGHVEEIESHGLFFLCSPSRAVRAVAVSVLRLITKFDIALGIKDEPRIISILEGGSQKVIDVNDERLTLAERSRLQKGLRKSNTNNTLIELCSSDVAHDTKLWFKVFPNLIRLGSVICMQAVALTRELVCQRLSHSYRIITALGEGQKQLGSAIEHAFTSTRPSTRIHSSSPDIVIEQWKIHLVFACTTLTQIGSTPYNATVPGQSVQHTRKNSKSSNASQDKITSATELFPKVVPFLSVPNPTVRSAAVAGLGATNVNLFQTLLETLYPYVSACSAEAKERLASHQRSGSNPRRSRKTDNLRTEITHLLSLTCHHLRDPSVSSDEYAITYIVDYSKHLRIFLSDAEIQAEIDLQGLRTHFCTLIDGLYECTRKLKDGSRWMSFQSRQATFALMENWCGFSPNESQLQRQREHFRRSLLEREGDFRSRKIIDGAFEKERQELQTAALTSMATLCAGPMNFIADGRVLMQFDVRRLLGWINAIFEDASDRKNGIGKKALQYLIVHNRDQPLLMTQTLRMCYIAKLPKALASYFEVVTKVLTEDSNDDTPFWKIVCAGLYTLGNEDSHIRMKSARLLRTLEERLNRNSKLQDLDISVSDKTTAVYKLAQFEISCRLANQHPDLAFHVFSEFSAYFNELQPDHQRNMVSGMLPWIQTIELQLDPNGGPTVTSYMLLVNLFEITVKSSKVLHNEIQALWQALATGPYAGNVQLVLDFIITVCLEKKEQTFVLYAKQIVVFLSKTPAGARVVDHLLMQICPKNMVAERREPARPPVDTLSLPYTADLALVLPSGAKQHGLSLGQLCMILLVDLVVSPFQLPPDKVPTLLQIILVQWDQYVTVVQENARELLVHLIHELVISKMEPRQQDLDMQSVEDFIELIRTEDPRIVWSYGDSEAKPFEEDGRAVSPPMAYVVDEVVRIFSITYPDLRADWGTVTMQWATSCAVRHVACRSFQVFRCVSTSLNQQMLADMLARLSNTIADDENHDYLVFSLEILMTLRSIIAGLGPLDLLAYPQLFWTTCACLDTIFEREFQEGLSMLGLLLDQHDMTDPAVTRILSEAQPTKWEGGFHGLHALIYKGMRSSQSMDRSLQIMERLIQLPSHEIIGTEDRILFTILANLPRYLQSYEDDGWNNQLIFASAETLALAAMAQNHPQVSTELQAFSQQEHKNRSEFLTRIIAAVRRTFFPTLEFQSLVFLLGMVNNQMDWFKVQTMRLLCAMIPDINMRKPEITCQGPDFISPLLRLLQTKHCQQALDVLDNVIDMNGTPLDNKHLRMSMAGSHSSRATRKEYDSTKSLYGIPEESGWSVPMPAMHSAQTRANVHAVFYTLALVGINGIQDTTTTPEIEFHKEDYGYDSYFADRTGTMMSDDTRAADGNIGELAEKLDTLDDFFDDHDASPIASGGSQVEQRESLYDQQALPILHRSLKRNASITSFQNGLAEARYQPVREPAIMNPAAFANNTHLAAPQRPGLHNRSVTSPATTLRHSPPRFQTDVLNSGDEGGDEPDSFSDDDLSIGRAQTSDRPLHIAAKPSTGFKAGLRSGIRRLTSSGGSREGREAARTVAASAATNRPVDGRSPRVPKVPTSYLRDMGPSSAEP